MRLQPLKTNSDIKWQMDRRHEIWSLLTKYNSFKLTHWDSDSFKVSLVSISPRDDKFLFVSWELITPSKSGTSSFFLLSATGSKVKVGSAPCVDSIEDVATEGIPPNLAMSRVKDIPTKKWRCILQTPKNIWLWRTLLILRLDQRMLREELAEPWPYPVITFMTFNSSQTKYSWRNGTFYAVSDNMQRWVE